MSIKDVIKKSFYENFVGGTGLSVTEILLILLIACLIGTYIFFVYKNFSKSSLYSKDLNVTLAGICVVVTAIMLAMQSNLIVSLGMVGALSIVRFRTAIKNPMDLLYLFWSISCGIVCGVGLYILAIVLCVIMTVMIFVLGLIPNSKAPTIIMIRAESNIDVTKIEKIIKDNCSYCHNCSTIMKNNELELLYEMKTKELSALTKTVYDLEGIKSVSCLEHDGQVRM